MSIELQSIDCNCNDCKFMVRDVAKFQQWNTHMEQLERQWFNNTVANCLEKARKKTDKHPEGNKVYEAEILSWKFQYSKSKVNYGRCTKFQKDISFLPNTCQLETQNCFEHRRA